MLMNSKQLTQYIEYYLIIQNTAQCLFEKKNHVNNRSSLKPFSSHYKHILILFALIDTLNTHALKRHHSISSDIFYSKYCGEM